MGIDFSSFGVVLLFRTLCLFFFVYLVCFVFVVCCFWVGPTPPADSMTRKSLCERAMHQPWTAPHLPSTLRRDWPRPRTGRLAVKGHESATDVLWAATVSSKSRSFLVLLKPKFIQGRDIIYETDVLSAANRRSCDKHKTKGCFVYPVNCFFVVFIHQS